MNKYSVLSALLFTNLFLGASLRAADNQLFVCQTDGDIAVRGAQLKKDEKTFFSKLEMNEQLYLMFGAEQEANRQSFHVFYHSVISPLFALYVLETELTKLELGLDHIDPEYLLLRKYRNHNRIEQKFLKNFEPQLSLVMALNYGQKSYGALVREKIFEHRETLWYTDNYHSLLQCYLISVSPTITSNDFFQSASYFFSANLNASSGALHLASDKKEKLLKPIASNYQIAFKKVVDKFLNAVDNRSVFLQICIHESIVDQSVYSARACGFGKDILDKDLGNLLKVSDILRLYRTNPERLSFDDINTMQFRIIFDSSLLGDPYIAGNLFKVKPYMRDRDRLALKQFQSEIKAIIAEMKLDPAWKQS